MGLLGKLVKNAVGEGLSKAVSGAVEKGMKSALQPKVNEWSEKLTNAASKNIDAQVEALDNATEALNEANAEMNANPEAKSAFNDALSKWAKSAEKFAEAAEKSEAACAEAVSRGIYEAGTAEYFAGIISENIPGVSVKLNVPAGEVADVPEKAANIDVLVLKDGAPKAAVILVYKNSYRTLPVVNTMNACEKNGIKALRFMKEFSNKEDYVTERIASAL